MSCSWSDRKSAKCGVTCRNGRGRGRIMRWRAYIFFIADIDTDNKFGRKVLFDYAMPECPLKTINLNITTRTYFVLQQI